MNKITKIIKFTLIAKNIKFCQKHAARVNN